MRNDKGQFLAGPSNEQRFPVGTIRIRSRHKREGERRAWIKVAEPNGWVLLARHAWEQANGPIPRGMGVHHKDENKLNDAPDNLELVSKSEHLAIHYKDYKEGIIANLTTHRRERRWSTKSETKRTGRPPTWTDDQMKRAIGEWYSTDCTLVSLSRKHRVPIDSLRKRIKAIDDLI